MFDSDRLRDQRVGIQDHIGGSSTCFIARVDASWFVISADILNIGSIKYRQEEALSATKGHSDSTILSHKIDVANSSRSNWSNLWW
jgi:hypothetical protein